MRILSATLNLRRGRRSTDSCVALDAAVGHNSGGVEVSVFDSETRNGLGTGCRSFSATQYTDIKQTTVSVHVGTEGDCVPLRLSDYAAVRECTTSGVDNAACAAAKPGDSYIDIGTAGTIIATAVNAPPASPPPASPPPPFGRATLVYTLPGAPRALDIRYTANIDASGAKMALRAGCTVEWSNGTIYASLVPFIDREKRASLKYTRADVPKPESAFSEGTLPQKTSVDTKLHVDASIDAVNTSGTMTASGTTVVLLSKSWQGQPTTTTGALSNFEPTRYRLFCGATVEDGDGTLMTAKVTLTDFTGSICYAKGTAPLGDGGVALDAGALDAGQLDAARDAK
jgi:hypothetical protein